MRVFSKKSFKFDNGDKSFYLKLMSFSDAPNWIRDTALFKLAIKDGSIEVIESKEQSKQLENNGITEDELALREKGKQLGINNYSKIGIDKLKKMIQEKESENNE